MFSISKSNGESGNRVYEQKLCSGYMVNNQNTNNFDYLIKKEVKKTISTSRNEYLSISKTA